MKKLCEFSTVWADWADLGSAKTAKLKLKYANFEGGFFNFSGANKKFNLFKKYPSVHTEKLHKLKVR